MATYLAIDSIFGVGQTSGNPIQFSCPPDTVLTGFSGGAQPEMWNNPQDTKGSYLLGLQWVCSSERQERLLL